MQHRPSASRTTTVALADRSGKEFYSGTISVDDDIDTFTFEATAGDRVFIALDGDPERDATGFDSPSTDLNAFAGLLVVRDPDGDVIFSDISDSNSIQSGPDYPAQGGFFVARATGTHYVEVQQQSSSQFGPTKTYALAIFLNDAAPALTDEVDPAIVLTPDYVNNEIAGTATDADSGVCSVTLFANDNLQITNLAGIGTGTATFDIELLTPGVSGSGKLLVADCQGNTACEWVTIDADAPTCDGYNFSSRTPASTHGPIWVPDAQSAGPGIDGTIDVAESGIISDVNVTITIETIYPPDMDVYLESPTGTRVELITDRGSSLAYDITDATFDDAASVIMSTSSSDAPYTGTWLPEDAAGLAKLNGEDCQGTWKLNVIDDSSSASGGARLVRWSLDIGASFAGPEVFAGTASDTEGIQSVVLSGATNVQLNLPAFTPGDLATEYTVTLVDPTQNGSGTVTVTDLQLNTCQSVISLNGLADGTGPSNSGSVTTDRYFEQEVQVDLPLIDPNGYLTTINVPDTGLVAEVEASFAVDTKDVGRIFATLSHGGEMASLLNRAGSDERGEPGLTKDILWIDLDDDAPQADDAHLEPALGTEPFLGLHQPDGRGEVIADGITADNRDNLLFALEGLDSFGDWDMVVGDNRSSGYSYSTRAVFRRWSMTLKNPCGPERYVGTTMDLAPGAGISTIALAAGATNLTVVAGFTPGDEIVDYRVELTDPSLPGSGTVEITDLASNVTTVPITLAAASGDVALPLVSGAVNTGTGEFEGTATDNQAGDGGVAAVELMPWSDNLQIVSVTPAPPAAGVDFVVGLVDPMTNGRGYVRVTDGCGHRAHLLVELDAQGPVCTGRQPT